MIKACLLAAQRVTALQNFVTIGDSAFNPRRRPRAVAKIYAIWLVRKNNLLTDSI
jgi:hypothetical protein